LTKIATPIAHPSTSPVAVAVPVKSIAEQRPAILTQNRPLVSHESPTTRPILAATTAPAPPVPQAIAKPLPQSAPIIARPPIHAVVEPQEGLTDAQIGASIKNGVDYLLRQFDPRTYLLPGVLAYPRGTDRGADVLAVYALMQCEQAIDDPRLNPHGPLMKGLIDSMKAIPFENYHWETYARGLRATALALYNRPEDRRALMRDVDALVRGAHNGAYTYSLDGSPSFGRRGGPGVWDNSNSQYGVLGVWSGAEVGVEVPTSYWEAVAGHWMFTQLGSGQWDYFPGMQVGTHTMTCAGLASMLVARDYLDTVKSAGNVGREPFLPSVSRGLQWLEHANNSVTIVGGGYGYYGLERVALASGFKHFGTHDWYRELAADVISHQQSDGSWVGRYGDLVDTSYYLLFLSRGRHPILMNKLRFDGSWANRPRDVVNLTRFAAHQLERPLNWQVVGFDRGWTDWADSPILYLASHKRINLSEDDYNQLRVYIDHGGLLFTQADGDSPEFNAFAVDLSKKLFPNYEMTDLPAGHPLCNIMYPIASSGLKIVSNGSRILMLHSTADLARYWQIRDNVHTPLPFQFGMNLFVYAAGKRDFRNRLISTYIAPPRTKPLVSFRIARLRYAGNWNPEPAAWERFTRLFQQNTGYGLDVIDVPIRDIKAQTAPFADLTGTAEYELTADEAAAIRNYVESGGMLLIDMCGGTGRFDQGLQSSLYFKVFQNAPPRVLPRDHPLLNTSASGMQDLARPRLRQFTLDTLGSHAGMPEMISAGRGHIILTSLDITTGLLGTETWGILGYDPSYAQALVGNAILWTLDGQRDVSSN